MQFLTCKYNFIRSYLFCFHVSASCSQHAFHKWEGYINAPIRIFVPNRKWNIQRLESVITQRNAATALACTPVLDLRKHINYYVLIWSNNYSTNISSSYSSRKKRWTRMQASNTCDFTKFYCRYHAISNPQIVTFDLIPPTTQTDEEVKVSTSYVPDTPAGTYCISISFK